MRDTASWQRIATMARATKIHRSVLQKLQDDTDDPWPWFGHDPIGDDRVGEDITFCHRARNAGFTIWGHSGVLLDHSRQRMENWDTFSAQDFAAIGRGQGVEVHSVRGGSDRGDLVEAARQKAVLIRRLYRKMRDHRGKIGKPESNGQKKKRAKLEPELRDAAIRARSLGLAYEAIEEMWKPG